MKRYNFPIEKMDADGPKNKLPLIPSSIDENFLGSLDISDILRQCTREFLERDRLERNSIYSNQLREEWNKKTKELNDVADALMSSQAKNLLYRDSSYREALESKDNNLVDIPDYYIDKYHLVRIHSVQPFDVIGADKRAEEATRKMETEGDIVLKHNICPHFTNLQEITEVTDHSHVVKQKTTEASLKLKEMIPKFARDDSKLMAYFKKNGTTSIVVEPKEFTFKDCIPGKDYSAWITLINKSPYSVNMNLVHPTNHQIFYLSDTRMNTKKTDHNDILFLAPGMNVKIKVHFKCNDIDDYYDEFGFVYGKVFAIKVPVKAIHVPPTLRSKCNIDTKVELTNYADHMTLEFGSLLTGSVGYISVPVYNTGVTATFYIIHDMNWIQNTTNYWTKTGTVKAPPFIIQPAIFKVGHNGSKMLTVKFKPIFDGVYIERYYIICNNYTIRPFYVIAEAVPFDSNYLKVTIDETDEGDVDDIIDPSCFYFINLGTTYPGTIMAHNLTIENISDVTLLYHWDKRLLKTEEVKKSYYDLPRSKITVESSSKALLKRTTTNFTINVNFKSKKVKLGLYKSKLSFIVDQIPNKSIDNSSKNLPRKRHQKDVSSIEVFCIEVWAEVVRPYVILRPYYVYIPFTALFRHMFKMYAINLHPFDLTLEWIPTEKVSNVTLNVENNIFTIKPLHTCEIEVSVEALYEGRFSVEAVFQVNGLQRYKALVEGCIETPTFKPEYHLIQMDTMRCKSNKELKFSITHSDVRRTPIYSREFRLRKIKPGGIECCTASDQIVCYSIDKNRNYCTNITYKCFTEEEEIYTSILEIVRNNLTTYTTMVYEVQCPSIYIIPYVMEIEETLYRSVAHQVKVDISNMSDIEGLYFWINEPIGKDSDKLIILDLPEFGIASPHQEVTTTFHIVPVKQGLVKDFQIPLYLSDRKQNLYLTIKCRVKDTKVDIHWYGSERISVIWPPELKTSKDFRKGYCCVCLPESSIVDIEIDEEVDDESEKEDLTRRLRELREKLIITFADSTMTMVPYSDWPLVGGKYYIDDLRTPSKSYVDRLIVEKGKCYRTERMYRHSIVDEVIDKHWPLPDHGEELEEEEEGQEVEDEDQEMLLTNEQENGTYIDVKYEYPWKCEYEESTNTDQREYTQRAINWFHGEAILFNLEVGKPEKQIITLSNMTPILERVTTQIEIYSEKIVDLSDILIKRYKENLWERNMQPGEYLLLSVDNEVADLPPYGILPITLTAYSTCWGTYVDQIKITIGKVMPIVIPIVVHVTQIPLHFTFSPNNRTPILRFASILPTQKSTQYVYIENTSPLSIKVQWLKFGPEIKQEEHADLLTLNTWNPFDVTIELFSGNSENFCKVRLIDYYGDPISPIFKVKPNLLYMKPKSKEKLEITFNPLRHQLPRNIFKSVLRGKLIGIIYVDERTDSFPITPTLGEFRTDGFRYDQVQLTLKAQVQVPMLRTVCSSDEDFVFNVHVGDILERKEFGYNEMRSIILKNVYDSTANVQVTFSEPFHLIKIAHINPNRVKGFNEAEVRAEEAIEIFYEVRLREEDIERNILDPMTNQTPLRDSEADELRKDPHKYDVLLIQQDVTVQTLHLWVNVIPPLIETSEVSITFGLVYINTTKELTLWLSSYHRDETVDLTFEKNDGCFDVIPKSVLLTARKTVEIVITFIPAEPEGYKNVLYIRTCYKPYCKTVRVEGGGIWDLKYGGDCF